MFDSHGGYLSYGANPLIHVANSLFQVADTHFRVIHELGHAVDWTCACSIFNYDDYERSGAYVDHIIGSAFWRRYSNHTNYWITGHSKDSHMELFADGFAAWVMWKGGANMKSRYGTLASENKEERQNAWNNLYTAVEVALNAP